MALICTYYGGHYDDSIKPKRDVTYYMLEQYMKDKVDREVKRLTTIIESKIDNISTNSLTDKTIASTFGCGNEDEENGQV